MFIITSYHLVYSFMPHSTDLIIFLVLAYCLTINTLDPFYA